MSNSRTEYRPEIDGLRAIAVLAVVLFHARLGVPGGYTGVDVFFVISGFLITGIVLRDLGNGSFRLRGFWFRRIRRLFPAMCVMVLACVAIGWLLLPPASYADLGRQIVSVVALSANVYFWRTTDYWGFAADDIALLHMWSLAVEEQFYLGMPFLLMALRRFPARYTTIALAVLAAASLAACVSLTPSMPTATFYLLPTRAWELLLGAGIASWLEQRRTVNAASAPFGFLGGWLGIAMIGYAAFAFDRNVPFPGWHALVPTCGTALVLWATSGSDGMLKTILSHPTLRFFGLISYSLYLWHWPLLVFTRFLTLAFENTPAIRAAVVGLSVAAAFLSWKFVEQPFRRETPADSRGPRLWGIPRTRLVAFSLGLTAMLVCGGVLALGRLPTRLAWGGRGEALAMAATRGTDALRGADAPDDQPLRLGRPDGEPELVILGSSHGVMYLPALDRSLKSIGVGAVSFARGATNPLVADAKGWSRAIDVPLRERDRVVMDYIAMHRPKVIVCFHRWSMSLDESLPWLERRTATLDRKASALTAWVAGSARHWGAFGSTVLIVDEVPQSCSSKAIFEALLHRGTVRGYEPDLGRMVRTAVAEHLRRGGADAYRYVMVSQLLEDADRTVAIGSPDGRQLYYGDDNHLSEQGASMIVDAVLQAVILETVRDPMRAD